MNEFTKTIVFAAVGSLLVASAFGVHVLTQPEVNEEFALVGEEFFPEFDSPSSAKFLEIAAFDFEKREPVDFRVEYKDKMWRIPSHHGYPAEAADRLARTAASVMGIRREAIGGRRESDHKRFGVIDPKSDEAKKISKSEKDAVGVRVTIGKGNGNVLADYIIGKEVETRDMDDEFLREVRGETEQKPLHYVRRPDEKETYIASIEVDASTKFSEWIEPDLLLLDSGDLRQLVINDYSFETKVEEIEVLPGVFQQVARSEKVDGESYTLTKDTDFGSWELEGLDEETEELESSKISDLTRSLDNLQILGVRPRVKIDGEPILTPDLKIEFPESIRSQGAAQRAIQQVAMDLESKGFILSQDPSDQSLSIASDQGELTAATNEGVVYRLYFGKVFTGTETEIEIGGGSQGDEEKADTKETEKEESDTEGDEDGDSESSENGDSERESDDEDSDQEKSRFLLVRVEFDEQFLGEKPTPPVEPKEPEKPAEKKEEQENGDSAEKPEPPAPSEKEETASESTEDEGDEKQEPNTTDDSAEAPEENGTTASDATEKTDSQPADTPDSDSDEQPSDEKSEDAPAANDDSAGADEDKQDSSKEDAEKKDGQVEKEESADKDEDAENDESAEKDANAETSESADKDETEDDPEAEYQKALQEYQLAKIQYDDGLTKYEEDLKKYEENLAEGKNKVASLNQRFADWYYVISAESLENLRLSRSDLVREKEKPEDEDKDDDQASGDKPMDDAAAANQKAADEFLAENKTKEGVVTTDSGLQYKVLTKGEGESPTPTRRVKVKYKGTLLDGTVFDESGDDTIEFQVDGVIKGWTEALQLMKPGAKWRLFIPPDLAYGERGSPPKIGPNSLLIFEVELVSFE